MGRAQALQSTLQAVLQDVCLDIGGERASLQWKISLRVSESLHVREYTLWDQAPTAEFVHAQVDVHGASKALYTHVESRDGRMVLHVPPIERPCTIALTIYAKIAFLPRLSGAPTAIRCPVLLCEHNVLQCRFFSYKMPLHVRTKHPERISMARWVERGATPLWSAHFVPLNELVLEWMPAKLDPTMPLLQAHSARVECHLSPHLSLPIATDRACTVLDVDFHVHLAELSSLSPEDMVPLPCTVSSGDTSCLWTFVLCDCPPDLAQVAQKEDPPGPLVLHRSHVTPASVHTFTLHVHTQRVCASFGEPSLGLSFHVRGRIQIAHRGDAPYTWTSIPHLTLGSISLSPLYYIHTESSLFEPGYALHMQSKDAREHWRPVSSSPGPAPTALRWVLATRHSPSSMPPLAPMHVITSYHEVWPRSKKKRVEHCVHLHAGPLPYGTYEVCCWASRPAQLEAYVNGHPVPVHLDAHTSTTTHIDSAHMSPPVWYRAQCVLATPGHTHVLLRYSTPWPLDVVIPPAFSVQLPIFLLRVHPADYRCARFDPFVDAHITYGEAALATWFDLSPCKPMYIPVHFPRTFWCRKLEAGAALLGVMAFAWVLVAFYTIHTTTEQVLLRTDVLAMALDVDFSDGAWLPAAPTKPSGVSWWAAWLQAPWTVPVSSGSLAGA